MMTRWAGVIWLILVTVMVGGGSLVGYLSAGDMLDEWQIDQFRAGHAHGGVLSITALLYLVYLERTPWSRGQRSFAIAVLLVGALAQSGGFFLHMLVGEPGSFSAGRGLTVLGALLLASAVIALGISLIRTNTPEPKGRST